MAGANFPPPSTAVPGHPPSPYAHTAFHDNPQGYAPEPPPKPGLPGFWSGSPTPLTFSSGTSPVVRTATWQSATFDFRPEFRASSGYAPSNTQPIWGRTLGSGGRLWVQLVGWTSLTSSKVGLRVRSTEYAHVINPQQLIQINDGEDVTCELASVAPSDILSFLPPGDGYPVRFWRVSITVDYLVDNGSDPVLIATGAYY